jgi:integrase
LYIATLREGVKGFLLLTPPVLLVGYHTGMRLEEILTLVWDRESRVAGCVDLEKGRVYLPASITKTKQARTVPLSPTVRSVLHDMKQAGGITRISGLVFTKDGKKLAWFKTFAGKWALRTSAFTISATAP